MKKFLVILFILLFAVSAQAWTISWEPLMITPDGYVIRYKPYPSGYSLPNNPAPQNLLEQYPFMYHGVGINTSKSNIEVLFDLVPGQDYVFGIRARTDGILVGESGCIGWHYPGVEQIRMLEITE